MKEKVKPICVSALIALVVAAAICLVADYVIRFVDGFPFGIFISIFICFFFITEYAYVILQYTHIQAIENQKKLHIQFYKECIEKGIEDISSPANNQKAKLIAKRLGCKGCKNLADYFEEGRKLYTQAEDQGKAAEKQKKLAELRSAEKEKYDELTKYASFEGREKRVAILSDTQRQYYKKAAELEKGMRLLTHANQQKEINWATHGGIASGIAGGAAGLAVAIDAQVKNAQIRAQNEANMRALIPGTLAVHESAGEYRQAAKDLQVSIDDAKIKLVADTPKDEVFSKLDIRVSQIAISETGAFTIQVSVKLTDDLMIFDNVQAVADGTFSANLYQEGHNVGNALLVLPTFGVDRTEAIIEGICLSGAKQGIPYEVQFTPYLLWEMEK